MISTEYLKNMPYTCRIFLNSFQRINDYINIAEQSSGEIYLMCNNKIVTGRSLMGIFTLDLYCPIWLYSAMPLELQMKDLLIPKVPKMVS